MLEGKGNSISTPKLQKAIKQGAKEAQIIISTIESLQKAIGKPKRAVEPEKIVPEDVSNAVNSMSEMRLREVFRNSEHDKMSRDQAVNDIRTDVVEKVWSSFPDVDPSVIQNCFNKCCKHVFRSLIFDEERRCDGRSLDDIRNITCDVNLHKPLHGSSLFQRGQTQVFCTVALDSLESALKLDHISALDAYVMLLLFTIAVNSNSFFSVVSSQRTFFYTTNFHNMQQAK